ncbi:hypothetical protein ACFW04_007094 [Cataglyphis niger]
MEEVSVENAKVSDSGYSNTCSNSQSQRSSGSESSGYCDRRPSTLGSSNETLPQPISKRKDKEYKKKKSKAVSALNASETEVGALKTSNALPEVASYTTIIPTNTGVLDEKPGWFRNPQKTGNECTQTVHSFLSYESLLIFFFYFF